MDGTIALVEQAVSAYRSRGFENLMVSYGCTGGQHRSVYCAERLQKHLQDRLKVATRLVHRDLEGEAAAEGSSDMEEELDGCLPG